MNVELRRMSDEDFENYVKYSIKVYSQGMLDEKEYPNYQAAYESGYREITNFYATLREGESIHPHNIIDTEKSVIVGYLAFSHLIYEGQKIAFIDYIEVFPQFRRQGYAQKAMAIMENKVRADNIKIIDLNVMLHKIGAQKLYKGMGYDYRRPRYLGPNPEQITRFDMRKVLD